MARIRRAASRRRVTFLVLSALALGELAVGAWILFAGSVRHRAIAFVPNDAVAYVHAFVSPSRAQKRSLQRFLANVPRLDTDEEAEDAIAFVLDSLARRVGLSYEEDVKPWVGREIAFFVTAGGGRTFLIETNDEQAALDAVDRARAEAGREVTSSRSLAGTDYDVDERGLAAAASDGFVIVGDEAGVEAALTVDQDSSLSSSPAFAQATEGLDHDRIMLAYVDPMGLGELPTLTLASRAPPFAMIGYVTPRGIVLESSLPEGTFTAGSEILAALPGETWLALALGDVDDFLDAAEAFPPAASSLATVEEELQISLRDDLRSWGRQAALFVMGGTIFDVSPGAIFTAHRAAPASATLDSLARSLSRALPGSVESDETEPGFTVSVPQAPGDVRFELIGERVVVAYGSTTATQVLSPAEPLAANPTFARAVEEMGTNYFPYLYADLEKGGPLLNLALQTWAGVDVDDVVGGFSYVVGGLRHGDGRIFHKVLLGVGGGD